MNHRKYIFIIFLYFLGSTESIICMNGTMPPSRQKQETKKQEEIVLVNNGYMNIDRIKECAKQDVENKKVKKNNNATSSLKNKKRRWSDSDIPLEKLKIEVAMKKRNYPIKLRSIEEYKTQKANWYDLFYERLWVKEITTQ